MYLIWSWLHFPSIFHFPNNFWSWFRVLFVFTDDTWVFNSGFITPRRLMLWAWIGTFCPWFPHSPRSAEAKEKIADDAENEEEYHSQCDGLYQDFTWSIIFLLLNLLAVDVTYDQKLCKRYAICQSKRSYRRFFFIFVKNRPSFDAFDGRSNLAFIWSNVQHLESHEILIQDLVEYDWIYNSCTETSIGRRSSRSMAEIFMATVLYTVHSGVGSQAPVLLLYLLRWPTYFSMQFTGAHPSNGFWSKSEQRWIPPVLPFRKLMSEEMY